MAKFTKLNIGDSVASSGGRVWKKLSAESEEQEIILEGTWVFNAELQPLEDGFTVSIGSVSGNKSIGSVNSVTGDIDYFCYKAYSANSNGEYYIAAQVNCSKTTATSSWQSYYNRTGGWTGTRNIVTFNTYADSIATTEFKNWVKANATKQ